MIFDAAFHAFSMILMPPIFAAAIADDAAAYANDTDAEKVWHNSEACHAAHASCCQETLIISFLEVMAGSHMLLGRRGSSPSDLFVFNFLE